MVGTGLITGLTTSMAMTQSKGSGTPVVYRSRILGCTSSLSVMPIFTIPGIAGLVSTSTMLGIATSPCGEMVIPLAQLEPRAASTS